METFATLLRRHRLERQLTQEELAALAGVSSRSIGELERGRSPRPRNLEQLASALRLGEAEAQAFVAAGRELFWANRPGQRRSPAPDGGLPAVAAPRQLPGDLPDFVGRDAELDAMLLALGEDRGAVVAVSGPPGVGKTALAVHAAQRVASRFAGGQLFARLRDTTGQPVDPVDVVGNMLHALGTDGSAMPAGLDARSALLRARLAERPVLLLLDDAAGHRQVEPFMPVNGSVLVVTSRLPLTGLAGVRNLDLRPLTAVTAVELLQRIAGTDRVLAEPAAAAELVDACGGLPLAVRIAGARLSARPHWTVRSLADRLADDRRRLDELRHGDLAVRPSLDMSYADLTPTAARAFRLLGSLRLPACPAWMVTAVLGADQALGVSALDDLLDARLLDDLGPDRAGQRRYRFHEVTRLYARERFEADPDDGSQAAVERVASGLLALARVAQARLDCERFHIDDGLLPATLPDAVAAAVAAEQPLDWFEAQRETLMAVVQDCADAGLAALAHGIVGASTDFYELRGYYTDWQQATTVALRCCRRTGDRAREAALLRGLGSAQVELGQPAEALSTLEAARALAEEVGDRAGAAMVRKDRGFMLSLSGRLVEAETELRAADRELSAVDRQPTRAMALSSLGFVQRQRGETEAAIATIRTALAIARSCGDAFVEAYVLRGLAGALLAAGRSAQAAATARQAADQFVVIGDPIGAAQSFRALGESLADDPGSHAEAMVALRAAATIFRERGNYWGLALTELTLGEVSVRNGVETGTDHLQRSLRYWTEENVPALQARTLVALGSAAEQSGDAAARDLLMRAYELYQRLQMPAAAQLAVRLGIQAR
ncbi:helix-turn-helix domain-containing protein [Asanoa sp. NPDC049518]|uniref:helix-turn-helix domain-containing protein n=1 Tax=unclassified Asanoa TaxID=2685164 RepID=UPI00341FEF95